MFLRLWPALLGLAFLVSCTPVVKDVSLKGHTMGTTYSVKYAPGETQLPPQEISAEIHDLLVEVNRQFSTYINDSELSQFNQAPANTPVKVSDEVIALLREAIRLNKVTDGALNVTVGPLVNLWGFGPEAAPTKVPTEADIKKAQDKMGLDKIIFGQGSLSKTSDDLYLDLSSIAKGYGVDVIVQFLESKGLNNYQVEIGGETRTRGVKSNSQGWRIGILSPNTQKMQAQQIISPGDMAIATSGDYYNFYERDGVRYSHIIDPNTGRPLTHKLVSVSVLHPSCATADGLSTAIYVMGPEKGLALANRINLPVFMIVKGENGFEERYSETFAPYLNRD